MRQPINDRDSSIAPRSLRAYTDSPTLVGDLGRNESHARPVVISRPRSSSSNVQKWARTRNGTLIGARPRSALAAPSPVRENEADDGAREIQLRSLMVRPQTRPAAAIPQALELWAVPIDRPRDLSRLPPPLPPEALAQAKPKPRVRPPEPDVSALYFSVVLILSAVAVSGLVALRYYLLGV